MTNAPSSSFETFISTLPDRLSVLDVGCYGLEGENTTSALVKKYYASGITGINKNQAIADQTEMIYPFISMIVGEYPEIAPPGRYDLVVLDLNIEGNLRNWSPSGLKIARKLLKNGGFLINYILATEHYDSEETGKLIKAHWEKYWGKPAFDMENVGKKLDRLPGWEFHNFMREERRQYIYWVALRKV